MAQKISSVFATARVSASVCWYNIATGKARNDAKMVAACACVHFDSEDLQPLYFTHSNHANVKRLSTTYPPKMLIIYIRIMIFHAIHCNGM